MTMKYVSGLYNKKLEQVHSESVKINKDLKFILKNIPVITIQLNFLHFIYFYRSATISIVKSVQT